MWTKQDKERIKHMIMYYHDELVRHGFPVYDITEVKYGRSPFTWGYCQKRHFNKTATIKISEICLRSTEECLKTIILHELCHATSNTKGHDLQFYEYGRKIENIFHVHIEKYINKKFITTNTKNYEESKYKYYIYCRNCGAKFKYMRKTKFVESVLNRDGKYMCRCGNKKFNILTK